MLINPFHLSTRYSIFLFNERQLITPIEEDKFVAQVSKLIKKFKYWVIGIRTIQVAMGEESRFVHIVTNPSTPLKYASRNMDYHYISRKPIWINSPLMITLGYNTLILKKPTKASQLDSLMNNNKLCLHLFNNLHLINNPTYITLIHTSHHHKVFLTLLLILKVGKIIIVL